MRRRALLDRGSGRGDAHAGQRTGCAARRRAAEPVTRSLDQKVVWARTYTPQEGEPCIARSQPRSSRRSRSAVASCGGSETTTLDESRSSSDASRLACRRTAGEQRQREREERDRDRRLHRRRSSPARGCIVDKTRRTSKPAGRREGRLRRLQGQACRTALDLIEKVAAAARADVQRAMRAVQADAEAAIEKIAAAARRLGVEGCS